MSTIDYLAGAAAERNICERIAYQREIEHGNEIRAMQARVDAKLDELYGQIDHLKRQVALREREVTLRDEMLAGMGITPPQPLPQAPEIVISPIKVEEDADVAPRHYRQPDPISYEVLEPSSGRPILAILIIAGLLAWGTVAGIQKISASGFFAKPLPVSIPGEVGKFLKPSTITLESYGCMECHSKGGPAKSFAGLRDEMDSKRTFDQKRAVYHRLYKAVDSKPIAHRFQLTRAEKDVLVDLTLRTPRGGW